MEKFLVELQGMGRKRKIKDILLTQSTPHTTDMDPVPQNPVNADTFLDSLTSNQSHQNTTSTSTENQAPTHSTDEQPQSISNFMRSASTIIQAPTHCTDEPPQTVSNFVIKSSTGNTYHVPELMKVTHCALKLNLAVVSCHFPTFNFLHFLQYLNYIKLHTGDQGESDCDTKLGYLILSTNQPNLLEKLVNHFFLLQSL